MLIPSYSLLQLKLKGKNIPTCEVFRALWKFARIGGGRYLTWLFLRLCPMGLEVVHHRPEKPLQCCNSATMPVELLDLGRFILGRLEFFSNKDACTLSCCLERRCSMKLAVLPTGDPRLLAENCVYLGEYYPVSGGR